jgi:hypothetical protein
LLDAHRYIQAHGQLQRLQWRGGGVFFGLWRAANAQFIHVHAAKAQLSLQQGLQSPSDVSAFDLYLQGGAGPAQPVNPTAMAQAAFNAIGLELLVCRHPAGNTGQRALQRVGLTGPPPGHAQQRANRNQ